MLWRRPIVSNVIVLVIARLGVGLHQSHGSLDGELKLRERLHEQNTLVAQILDDLAHIRDLPGVQLVDSASSTAQAVVRALDTNRLRKHGGVGTTRFLVTDNKARFVETGNRFFGADPHPTELIDLDDVDQAAWAAEVAS